MQLAGSVCLSIIQRRSCNHDFNFLEVEAMACVAASCTSRDLPQATGHYTVFFQYAGCRVIAYQRAQCHRQQEAHHAQRLPCYAVKTQHHPSRWPLCLVVVLVQGALLTPPVVASQDTIFE